MLLDALHFVVKTPTTSLLDAIIQSIQWFTGSSTQTV
ncbi:hypothetical protein RHA1_ro03157 [Rhodococcus jostii RHA1]|uniref:Uncharacterized protein n=1 Tax=Rhodococcus jostii (strain RHA1) TaxID=101510 RepID=Q0SBX6_RHOJR|nr:hypothetical protein RHA1_ro03157 [Rhodococcus jostii RHA1]